MTASDTPLDLGQLATALKNGQDNWRPAMPNQEAQLWRYMDLGKFLALIQTGELYFPAVSALEDLYEGSLTEYESGLRLMVRTAMTKGLASASADPDAPTFIFPRPRERVFVSCWYGAEDESEAMWRLYGGHSNMVCIGTTARALLEAFIDGTAHIMMGMVAYVDMPSGNPHEVSLGDLPRFFRKRRSLEHEREVRLLTHCLPEVAFPPFDPAINPARDANKGVRRAVDPDRLISKVIVAPGSQEWFVDVVRRSLQQNGITKTVHRSRLDVPPLYDP